MMRDYRGLLINSLFYVKKGGLSITAPLPELSHHLSRVLIFLSTPQTSNASSDHPASLR
jgi:hypothetical protein